MHGDEWPLTRILGNFPPIAVRVRRDAIVIDCYGIRLCRILLLTAPSVPVRVEAVGSGPTARAIG
jgi:hypothetical protein